MKASKMTSAGTILLSTDQSYPNLPSSIYNLQSFQRFDILIDGVGFLNNLFQRNSAALVFVSWISFQNKLDRNACFENEGIFYRQNFTYFGVFVNDLETTCFHHYILLMKIQTFSSGRNYFITNEYPLQGSASNLVRVCMPA